MPRKHKFKESFQYGKSSTVSTESRKIKIFMPYWAGRKKRMEPGSFQLSPETRVDGHKWQWGRVVCSSIGPSSCPSWKWGSHLFSSSFWAFLPVAAINQRLSRAALQWHLLAPSALMGAFHQNLQIYGFPVCFSIPWLNPLPPRWLKDNFFILVFNWKWYLCLLATRRCLSDSSYTVQVLTRAYLLK